MIPHFPFTILISRTCWQLSSTPKVYSVGWGWQYRLNSSKLLSHYLWLPCITFLHKRALILRPLPDYQGSEDILVVFKPVYGVGCQPTDWHTLTHTHTFNFVSPAQSKSLHQLIPTARERETNISLRHPKIWHNQHSQGREGKTPGQTLQKGQLLRCKAHVVSQPCTLSHSSESHAPV